MNIEIQSSKPETKKFLFNGTVLELLNKLNINPETVLVTKNKELVNQEEKLNDKDSVKILSVVSGG